MNIPKDYRTCPLMICGGATIKLSETAENDVLRMVGCLKNACAWWDVDKECCAVLSIARNK